MKVNKVLPMLAVATFALAACAPKVDYKKFHEKAEAAAKEAKDVTFSKVEINGKLKVLGEEEEFKKVVIKFEKNVFVPGLDEKEIAAAGYLNAMRAEVIPEDKDTTYYAGSTFKIESNNKDEKGKMEFNKYGLMTLVDTKSDDDNFMKLTAKYSK